MHYEKKFEEKALIHLCPLFSALRDLPREEKLFEDNFRQTFFTNFSFLGFL